MTKQIMGIEVDISGAGDHMRIIDNIIRHVKEIMRSVFHSLPWKQPEILDEALGLYAVSRFNLHRRSATGESPRVAFTGRKPSYKVELSVAYGDNVAGRDPSAKSNAVQDSRVNSLIALYPCGNSTGSWVCYAITTKKYVRRTDLTKLVTTDLIIDQMNQLSEKGEERSEVVFEDGDEERVQDLVQLGDSEKRVTFNLGAGAFSDSESDDEDVASVTGPSVTPLEELESLPDNSTEQDVPIVLPEAVPSVLKEPSERSSARVKAGMRMPERYRDGAASGKRGKSGKKAKMYESYHTCM